MKQIVIGLTLFFFVFGQVLHADIVVITDNNKIPKFVLDTSTGKVSAVNGVYVEGGTNPTPPGPPIPEPPETDKYSAIHGKLTESQGQALAFTLYAASLEGPTDAAKMLKEIVDILDIFVDSKGAYSKWLNEVLALGPPNLNEIVNSLAKHFNVKLDDFNTAKSGGDVPTAYAFDWLVWLPLILKIIQLLKDSGILKNE
jgi:hypothetical protein